MAERYIDGMRVLVDGEEDSVAEVGIPIEVVLAGEEEENVIEVTTPEEHLQAQEAWDRAQQIVSLKDYVGYEAILALALENAQIASAAERSYRGVDEEKVQTLRLARIVADANYHFLRSTVEDAESVPRPVFTR